ncbi:Hypothetical predicted protein [Octopus vulgaris]|uniref:Uncharacterized protein n=1 Tax=Octopus vulgaris TaxID=6645 RepID=A0AA36EX71_OCTVU|nr:Hypothetical predicted protein [Octopus vulgaris]
MLAYYLMESKPSLRDQITVFELMKSDETNYEKANVYNNLLMLPNVLTTTVEISTKSYDTWGISLQEILFFGFAPATCTVNGQLYQSESQKMISICLNKSENTEHNLSFFLYNRKHISGTILTNQMTTTDDSLTTESNGSKCICHCNKTPIIPSETEEQLEKRMQETRKELTVEKKATSQYLATKISAPDERTSSQTMGVVAIVMLSVVGGLIVIPDVLSLIKNISERF